MAAVDEAAGTPGLARSLGLSDRDWSRILEMLGRSPSVTELGVFSAMWNEHCSYKSTRVWLRTLPTRGPKVIIGPGENAGVVDIGDGKAVAFKIESHNHPSFVEPYQGAATGVGGILRDIFTMGARPVAVLNALRFGDPEHPRTRTLVAGAIAGIGGYGNSFGVPTVGGEIGFDPAYDGNCLVNAFAAGLVDRDAVFTSRAEGVGRPIVYVGARTGRDGIGGATMASAGFAGKGEQEAKRPAVQVGDPFSGKRLCEACLELMASGAVVAIQDMGAAGLTCSAVEMGDKGGLGVALDLDAVPCRDSDMSAFEIMLSESQERMLFVLRPEMEPLARTVFEKWDLAFEVVGRTTSTGRLEVRRGGVRCADLPLRSLAAAAPVHRRPWTLPTPSAAPPVPPAEDLAGTLAALLGSHALASRRWVWEQYDHMVMADTVLAPGADAAVTRIHGSNRALAFALDCNPHYCRADPVVGGRQAVAEACRNLRAVGARPLAITNCLNFGDPERPEIMGQLVGCVQGIAEACGALDAPVVSGNVSLYNETDGRAILPTPVVGAVGLIDDLALLVRPELREPELVLILFGASKGRLHRSAYARLILGRDDGPPPEVDLRAERRTGDLILALGRSGALTACRDVSDGGLAVTAAENGARGRQRRGARGAADRNGTDAVVLRRGPGAIFGGGAPGGRSPRPSRRGRPGRARGAGGQVHSQSASRACRRDRGSSGIARRSGRLVSPLVRRRPAERPRLAVTRSRAI